MQAPLDLVLGHEQGFFFFQVCKVGWSGAHPQEDSVRFGYRLEMKVKGNLEP
jgi:hypothetical protein